MTTIIDIQRIAEIQFSDIVLDTYLLEHKLRITLIDSSFIDVHVSQKLSDKFSFHWETKNAENSIYRYDNFPDKNWSNLSSYPSTSIKAIRIQLSFLHFPPMFCKDSFPLWNL